MKKSLIIAAFAAVIGCSSAMAQYVERLSLSKDGWSVTGCTWAPNEGQSANGNGNINNVIDGNIGTYWHTNYSAGTSCDGTTATSHLHWIQLDLGQQESFDVIAFIQRQDTDVWNGAFTQARVWVSNEAFPTTGDAEVIAYADSTTPTLTATISTSTKQWQLFEFDQTQTGQYLLIIPGTTNPGYGTTSNNKFACLAEVSLLHKDTQDYGDNKHFSVLKSTGTRYRSGSESTATYTSEWRSFPVDYISFSIMSNRSSGNATNDIGVNGDHLTFHAGNDEGESSRTYKFASFVPNWYVKEVRFNYTNTGTNSIMRQGSTTTLQASGSWVGTNDDPDLPIQFTLIGDNTPVEISYCEVLLAPIPLYLTGLEGMPVSRTDRKTGSLAIADNVGSTSVTLSDLQSSASSMMYFDKTESIFNTAAGATVTITPTAAGTYMQNYLYVDWDGNGFAYSDDSDYLASTSGYALKEGSELVAYSSKQIGSTWYNSEGTTFNNGNRSMSDPLTFTIPAGTSGTYRIRYKVDWNNFDPKGQQGSSNHIQANGGIVVDFTINVVDKGALSTQEEANTQLTEARSNVTDILNLYSGIFTPAEMTTYGDVVTNAAADFTSTKVTQQDINSAIDNINASFSHQIGINASHLRVVTLTNARQAEQTNDPYITVTADNSVYATSTLTERGKWAIFAPEATNPTYFVLFNPETRRFLSTDNQANAETANADNALHFTLVANSHYENAVALHIVGTENLGLNVDPVYKNLAQYDETTNGSAWVIQNTGTAASDVVVGNYYRIRSVRTLWNNEQRTGNHCRPEGTLVGIQTKVEHNTTTSNVATRHDGLGTIWQITDASDDKVYLRNVAADYEGNEQLLGINSSSEISDTPMAVKLVNAKDAIGGSYSGIIPYSIAIQTHSNPSTSTNNHFDANNVGLLTANTWNPESQHQNSGTLFYLEDVTDAQLQVMVDEYLAKAPGNYQADIDAAKELVRSLSHASALWDKELAQAAAEKIDDVEIPYLSVPTSVKAANSDATRQTVDATIAEINALATDTYNSAIGRELTFTNAKYTTRHLAGNDGGLTQTDKAYNLSTVWTVVGTDTPGVYKLHNYGKNNYAGYTSSQNAQIPLSTDGRDYEFIIPTAEHSALDANYAIAADNQVLIHAVGETTRPYLHLGSNTANIVPWNATHSSNWLVSVAEEDEDLTFENSDSQFIISHSSGSVELNETRHSTHVVKFGTFVEPEQPENPVARVRAYAPQKEINYTQTAELPDDIINATTHPTNGTAVAINLDDLGEYMGNEPGKYVLDFPKGYLKTAANTYSQPFKYVLERKSDGTTTVIDEIAADVDTEAADAEYFNLQGQRVTRPAHGIYLMRRGNTVTKVLK